MPTINLDDAQNQNIEVHKNQRCSLTFQAQTELGESFDANGKIVIAHDYGFAPIKTYIVGDGVTITDNELVWEFEYSDWNVSQVVYDFSFIRVANNQRDLKGVITVNNSLL